MKSVSYVCYPLPTANCQRKKYTHNINALAVVTILFCDRVIEFHHCVPLNQKKQNTTTENKVLFLFSCLYLLVRDNCVTDNNYFYSYSCFLLLVFVSPVSISIYHRPIVCRNSSGKKARAFPSNQPNFFNFALYFLV